MAYREGGPPPCHICEELSAAGCACCRRDTCAKHLRSERAGWCRKCADAYYVYMRKTVGMREYMLWFLGVIPLVIVTVGVASWVFVPTIAYVILGFPIMLWRGRVRRTNKFIALTHRRGEALNVAPPINEDYAQKLAEYDRKRDALISDRSHEHPDGERPAAPQPDRPGH